MGEYPIWEGHFLIILSYLRCYLFSFVYNDTQPVSGEMFRLKFEFQLAYLNAMDKLARSKTDVYDDQVEK